MRIWGTGLLNGMAITMRNLFRGPITVQYPHEKIELPERARWAVAPKYDDEGNPKCTACMACVRACPDYILDLEFTTREDRSKHIERFSYELGGCMMCGLCVEACPFDALRMSHEYELARRRPADLTYNLLTDVDAAAPRRERAAAPVPEAAQPGGSSQAGSPQVPPPGAPPQAGGPSQAGSPRDEEAR